MPTTGFSRVENECVADSESSSGTNDDDREPPQSTAAQPAASAQPLPPNTPSLDVTVDERDELSADEYETAAESGFDEDDCDTATSDAAAGAAAPQLAPADRGQALVLRSLPTPPTTPLSRSERELEDEPEPVGPAKTSPQGGFASYADLAVTFSAVPSTSSWPLATPPASPPPV